MLRRLRPYLSPPSADLIIAAPDDDAAVWRSRRGLTVSTVDTLVEGIDFRTSWRGFDFAALGRRLMTINLSDLAAMGAEPRHALISLCLRRNLPVSSVTALYRGIRAQARRYGFTVAGGDLSEIDGPLVLSATLFGEIRHGRPMSRGGARPGWHLAVTGTVGKAAAGLELLEARRLPRTASERRLIRALLDPVPRLRAGQILRESGIRVAGDISDGVTTEVARIAEASNVGAVIIEAGLPIDRGMRARHGNRKSWQLALGGSEDFELICAAPSSRMTAAASTLFSETGLRLWRVGLITEKREVLRLDDRGRYFRVRRIGYEHFR
ncbi:MAG: thiamine-phosphate kinase [Chloroflexi bacterium]|nr:MAG: thiamine-phosphate kinase [Chloroflexota bacterium]